MNNFELSEKAVELSDKHSAFKLAHMLLRERWEFKCFLIDTLDKIDEIGIDIDEEGRPDNIMKMYMEAEALLKKYEA